MLSPAPVILTFENMEIEMYPGFELHFEMTMRSFLGNEADHIASQAYSPQVRKKWY